MGVFLFTVKRTIAHVTFNKLWPSDRNRNSFTISGLSIYTSIHPSIHPFLDCVIAQALGAYTLF